MATVLNNEKLKKRNWVQKEISAKACYISEVGNSTFIVINTTDNTIGISDGNTLPASAWTLTNPAVDIPALKTLIDDAISDFITDNDSKLESEFTTTT